MTPVKPTVILGSAGRRLYLIEWFRDAFAEAGVRGQVVIAEGDPSSAAFSAGDRGCLLPRYDDPDFEQAFWAMIDDVAPDLYVPLNDYEIERLGKGIAARLRTRGVLVPGVGTRWTSASSDKHQMYEELSSHGIPTPWTVLGDDEDAIRVLARDEEPVVVKHRFGSGSSGVEFAVGEGIHQAVARSARTSPGPSGDGDPRRRVVVQPRLDGHEYGVDLVCDLKAPGVLHGVLARRKYRMRAGETDKAVSANAEPFQRVAADLARLMEVRGIVDTDMFVTSNGTVSVIDINPRFGGGYPFVHLAGADVPLLYVQQALGLEPSPEALAYDVGVVSAKFESVRITTKEQDAG